MSELKTFHVTTSKPRADGKEGSAIIPFQARYETAEDLQQALEKGGVPGFHLIYERIDNRTRRVKDKFERTLRKADCVLVRTASVEYLFS
jgi:hypothetical protein